MTPRKLVFICLAVLLPVSVGIAPASAQSSNQPSLYKAYYLEHEAKDYAAAKKLYDKVARADVSGDVERAARAGSGRCRDHLAAKNFAGLMPEDALGYCEIRRPGKIVEQLAGMLGLTGKDIREALAQRPNAASNMPFHIPDEVMISPALLEVFSGFGGAAAAITDFDPDGGVPAGVLVIHHGDTSLLKGLLETAFQFAPIAEKIADMPTFGIDVPELGRVTGVLTESLLVAGTGRDLVEGVINRLTGAEKASLGTRQDLAEALSSRGNGARLLAFADIQRILKVVKANLSEHDRREFDRFDAFADLDSLRWATFSFGIDDGEIGAEFAVRLADDHRNLAYNLMRLPPMSRKCLEIVPPQAAAVFGLGLNPALAGALDAASGGVGDAGVTGLDYFREVFGNLRSLCVFVIPGKMTKPETRQGPDFIPNLGLVLTVNDTARSRACWDQLLSIPGLVVGDDPVPPKSMKIGSTDVTAYAIPEICKVYMAELDGSIAIGATRNALKAAIRAHSKGQSILNDEVMGDVIARMPESSSVMFAAHVGRLAEVAAGSGNAEAAMVGGIASDLLADMIFSAGIGQAPNQFTVRCALRGLPDLNKALKQYGPMLNTLAGFASPVRTAPARKTSDDAAEVTRLGH